MLLTLKQHNCFVFKWQQKIAVFKKKLNFSILRYAVLNSLHFSSQNILQLIFYMYFSLQLCYENKGDKVFGW